MPAGRGATVALDGFGVEQGFEALAAGARLAAADGIRIRVFGPPDELRLDDAEGIEVVPTAEWIDNDEDSVPAVRARKEASVVRAARDVADGNSAALVSAGSTGATMAAATFGLRRLKGVQRPALAAQLPVPGKPVLFLDVGANVEVRAQHLIQFAFLGAAFAEAVMAIDAPAWPCFRSARRRGRAARRRSRRMRCWPTPRGSTLSATSRAAIFQPVSPTLWSAMASPAMSR